MLIQGQYSLLQHIQKGILNKTSFICCFLYPTLDSYRGRWQVPPVNCHISKSYMGQRFKSWCQVDRVGAADGCCSPLRWSSLNINKPPVELHLLWVLMRQTNTTLLQWLQSWVSSHHSAPAAACMHVCILRLRGQRQGECAKGLSMEISKLPWSGASFPNALSTLLKGITFEFLTECEGKEWGEMVWFRSELGVLWD